MQDTLPSHAQKIADNHPPVWKAYQEFGAACAGAGPLDARTQRLVKLALAIGRGSEGAVHSHVRRGLEQGLSAEELWHVALLAAPTLGFPAAVAAFTWIEDLLEKR